MKSLLLIALALCSIDVAAETPYDAYNAGLRARAMRQEMDIRAQQQADERYANERAQADERQAQAEARAAREYLQHQAAAVILARESYLGLPLSCTDCQPMTHDNARGFLLVYDLEWIRDIEGTK